jgi:hypothetical protein
MVRPNTVAMLRMRASVSRQDVGSPAQSGAQIPSRKTSTCPRLTNACEPHCQTGVAGEHAGMLWICRRMVDTDCVICPDRLMRCLTSGRKFGRRGPTDFAADHAAALTDIAGMAAEG